MKIPVRWLIWFMVIPLSSALAGEPIALPKVGTAQAAVKEIERMLESFSAGNLAAVEKIIVPDMIGRQELIDAMRQSLDRHKQMRITLLSPQMAQAGDVVVVQARWEKHALLMPSASAIKRQGRTDFFMKKSASGWQLVGQSGDNIFAP